MQSVKITEDAVLRCLEGAIDMHVHSYPDLIDRSGNDIEFALSAKKFKMGGFVIKSHYAPTTDRAILVNSIVTGTKVYGALSLNNAVGGINPLAVEVSGRLGARVIWFPTVDSRNEADKRNLPEIAHPPPWAKLQKELVNEGFPMPPVDLFNGNGDFTREVIDVIKLIKKYRMTLATGHISPRESIKLIKVAHEEGVDKIVVTHPEFPSTNFSIQEQQDLCKFDVYFERCYSMPATSKTTWDFIEREIRATGIEHNIISTDLGQKKSILPIDGMKESARILMEKNFREDMVRTMMVDNTQYLVG